VLGVQVILTQTLTVTERSVLLTFSWLLIVGDHAKAAVIQQVHVARVLTAQ
jgi:hypothetical protein